MTGDEQGFLQFGKDTGLASAAGLHKQAEILGVDVPVALPELADRAAPKVEIDGIAGKLAPVAGGLVMGHDPAKLEEGLRALERQEEDAKLRQLLDQAQRLLKKKGYRLALALVGQALEIAPKSSTAWILKGRCHLGLGEFEHALAALDKAREHAPDRDTVLLTISLREVWERQIIRELEHEFATLVQKGDFAGAERSIDVWLRRMPGHPALLYYRCAVLLLTDRLDEAKEAIESAALRIVTGDANLGVFRDLRSVIALKESGRFLDAARESLRKGNPKQAVTELAACRAEVSGTERFENLWSYAHERNARNARWAFMQGMRMRKAKGTNVRPLVGAQLEEFRCWLVGEEIASGLEAMKKGDFKLAEQICGAAERIDDGCNFIAYLHAAAIYRLVDDTLARPSANLGEAETRLWAATHLAAQASQDKLIGKLGNTLYTSVTKLREEVEKANAISSYFSDFNELMTKYGFKVATTLSRYERDSVVATLERIRSDVAQLRRDYHLAPQEDEVLRKLTATITRVMPPR